MILLFLIILTLFTINNSFQIKSIVKRKPKLNNFNMVNPLPGSDIGVPLNIFQNIYTNIHYGYDISTFKNIMLQFFIGYYTYGGDRFRDALEYKDNRDIITYKNKKEELYNYIIDNENNIRSSLDLTLGAILFTLLNDNNFLINLPFIFLLINSDNYKKLKKENGLLKPFYISILWTACSVFLPCVLHDHNYEILKYPLDYLTCMMSIFSLCTILDIKDIDEDKFNGIETIPVKYGKNKTAIITLTLLSLSSLIFGLNQNYLNRPIINSLNELQNMGMACIPFFAALNSTEAND